MCEGWKHSWAVMMFFFVLGGDDDTVVSVSSELVADARLLAVAQAVRDVR